MKPTETPRVFSQEQARLMYDWIHRMGSAGFPATRWDMQQIREEANTLLQAIDTAQPATDGGEAVRYALSTMWIDDNTKRWFYFEHPRGNYTEAEAQSMIDNLNAAQTGGESSD